MPLAKEPIVILGMFRSGTSCLSTALSKMGVYLGSDNSFFPPDEFNPGGYFEIKDLMQLNRRLLGALGMAQFQVGPIPPNWSEIPGRLQWTHEIRKTLVDNFENRSLWGWKEPQTSGLMPIYREVFRGEGLSPKFAICVRNPLEVASSQRTHGPLPLIGARTVGLWLHYTLSALRETRGQPRQIFVYDSFLKSPKEQLSRFAELFDTWKPSQEELESAANSVHPEWKHGNLSTEGLERWPSLVADLYQACREAADNRELLTTDAFDNEIESLWSRWLDILEMVRPNSIPASQVVFRWKESEAVQSRSVRLSPTGGWETVAVHLNAPAKTSITVDPYQTPCYVWIRKAAWQSGDTAKLGPGPNGHIDSVSGFPRLTVFGPQPLILWTPETQPGSDLTIELLIESNPTVMNDIVAMLRSKSRPNP